MSVRRGSEWEEWIYGVGLCYLVEGPARRFEACCQLTLADVVGVADDPGSVAFNKWLRIKSSWATTRLAFMFWAGSCLDVKQKDCLLTLICISDPIQASLYIAFIYINLTHVIFPQNW